MFAKDFLLTCIVVAAIGPFRLGAATIHYVDQNGSNPVSPYSDWSHAATNIQNAIDAATAGDSILVTNGIYQTGGRTFGTGALTNRVVIDKALTVQSVNGPAVTIIQGYQVPGTTNGIGAVRCVYLTNTASLIGFTLTNGATLGTTATSVDQQGGGIRSGSSSSTLSNCWILGNAAASLGGGAYAGTINTCTLAGNSSAEGGGAYVARMTNCLIISNSAGQGGGVSQAFLSECTLTNNSAPQGGGAYQSFGTQCLISQNSAGTGGGVMLGSLTNSMLTQNSAQAGGGAYSTTLTNCTIINNRSDSMGGGCYSSTVWNSTFLQNTSTAGGACYNCAANNCLIVSNQAVFGGAAHSGTYTNCTIVGNSAKTSGGGVYGGLSAWVYNSIVYFNTSATESTFNLTGAKSDYCCTDPFQSYTFIVTNAPRFVDPSAGDFHLQPNSPCINVGNNSFAHGIALDGNPRIVSATVDIGAYEFPRNIHYVSLSNTVPQSPYISWAHAATNIQDAIDSSTNGDVVLVANGLYKTGGRAAYGTLTNRATVNKPITLQSVNGPAVTSIEGSNPGFILPGPAPIVRCVYLTNGATLIGFTLTNGQAAAKNQAELDYAKGGGAYCEDSSGVISNCVLIGNNALDSGAVFRGTLFNCRLIANEAYGAGAAASNTLNNCSVIGNGTYASGLPQYINSQTLGSVLNNCTVALNDGPGPALVGCTANNSILYFNTNTLNAQYPNFTNSTLNYCCTLPIPATGANNFTNNPRFAAVLVRDLHPLATSPCINAGQNTFAFGNVDLDGNPRIRGGAVDIGAFEFQGDATGQFSQWLQQHALPADGSADFLDSDGDGMNNWQEWFAGTDPANPASLLQLATPTPTNSPFTITWQSVAGKLYFLQRGKLTTPFSTIQSNLVGQSGTTSYTDTNSVPTNSFFYRVGVQ